jgi:hypothetical protein
MSKNIPDNVIEIVNVSLKPGQTNFNSIFDRLWLQSHWIEWVNKKIQAGGPGICEDNFQPEIEEDDGIFKCHSSSLVVAINRCTQMQGCLGVLEDQYGYQPVTASYPPPENQADLTLEEKQKNNIFNISSHKNLYNNIIFHSQNFGYGGDTLYLLKNPHNNYLPCKDGDIDENNKKKMPNRYSDRCIRSCDSGFNIRNLLYNYYNSDKLFPVKCLKEQSSIYDAIVYKKKINTQPIKKEPVIEPPIIQPPPVIQPPPIIQPPPVIQPLAVVKPPVIKPQIIIPSPIVNTKSPTSDSGFNIKLIAIIAGIGLIFLIFVIIILKKRNKI